MGVGMGDWMRDSGFGTFARPFGVFHTIPSFEAFGFRRKEREEVEWKESEERRVGGKDLDVDEG